ncbi:MAG: bile acid:sodium symporter [Spirochaetota bacterium]
MATTTQLTPGRAAGLIHLSSLIQDRLVILLPIAMAFGFLVGLAGNVSALKGAVLPLTFMLVLPMMVGMDIRKLFGKVDVRLHGATLALNFLVIPFVAFGLGLLAFPDSPWLRLGLLLAALLPTSGMTVSWTGMSKGNVPEAVRMTIIGLIGGALSVPIYVSTLLGKAIDLPASVVVTQIAVIVVLPLVTGFVLRTIIVRNIGEPRFMKEVKPILPGISTLGVLALVTVAVALKARGLLSNPGMLWASFWPTFMLYAINFALSSLIGRRFFKLPEAKALVFGTVLRNLSIALALLMGITGSQGGEAALIVTWGFVIQVQGAAWYVRFAERILSRKPATADIAEKAEA